ncbi:MAG: glucokinase [bacterium]
MILAADVGGTKIQLALFSGAADGPVKETERFLATGDVRSLPDEIARFATESREPIDACGLGVAGPVAGRRVQGANLPWPIDADEIAARLGVPVVMDNDLVTSAAGLAALKSDELDVLREGRARPGANQALLSPGTGLGESILLPDGEEWRAVPSEGGHADFAARTDEEWEMTRWLRSRFGRANLEFVLSGPGLANVFEFLCDRDGLDPVTVLRGTGDNGPLPARVVAAARRGDVPLAEHALRFWISAFGAAAGNLVLRGLALGGLWLGGGMPARLAPELRAPTFLEAFLDKAPHRALLEQVPIRLVLSPETTLKGAARLAFRARA